MVEAAAIDPVRDTDRTQDVAPSSMPPARQPRHLMAAMATAAALVLFVVGAWIAQRSSILQPQVLPMKSSSARAATDRSWNSPILSPSPAIDSSALATRGITTIMVWPFTSFSGRDDADRHLADAMTDDLIASLSHFPTLRVISRMTAFSYRDRDADAASTGSDLGVRYVVEGSVRSIGNVLRVNVELIDAASRLQIWGDHFERDEAHRSAVQDEIVARLARELEVGVASALSRGSGHGRAGEPEVADLIAKGQMAQYRGPQAENLNEARAYFQGALARDPELVPALVGVAVPDIMGSINYIYDAGPTLKRAATFLGRARELEPDSALVNYWTGLIQKARGASAAALRSLQRTLELNPSFTPAYAQTASVLTILGRTSEAMGPVTYAMRLSPNDPSMNIWALIAGRAEIENGHDAAALEWFRRSVELAPNNPNTHMCLASTYALLGDDENAVRELAEFKRLSASAASQHSRDDRLASEGRTNLRLFQGLRIALALRS
jgi:TolB-like protein